MKIRTSEAKLKYTKQKNLCVSLLRNAKRNYYENLDLNDINDNKKFWTTVKSLFCNKIKSVENITLDENGKLVRNEKEVANIFNDFFVNIVPNLGINKEHDFLNTTNISHNPIENAIYKYEKELRKAIMLRTKLILRFYTFFFLNKFNLQFSFFQRLEVGVN